MHLCALPSALAPPPLPLVWDGCAAPLMAAEGGARESRRLGRVRELITEQSRLGEAATEELRVALAEVLDELGPVLRAAVSGAGDDAAVRAALLGQTADDILEAMDVAGLVEAREAFIGSYGDALDTAAEILKTGGVRRVDAYLDSEGFAAALEARLGIAEANFWDTQVERLIPEKVRAELLRSSRFEPLERTIQRAVDAGKGSLAQVATEARTDRAAFDRWTHAQVATEADPDGAYLLGYTGPDDRIERPFCNELNGYAFSRSEFLAANNAQVGHPIDYGGGWNCRHRLLWLLGDLLDDFGFERGDAGIIQKANRAAVSGKKGPGRRRE